MLDAVRNLFDRSPAIDRIEDQKRGIDALAESAGIAFRDACLDVEEGKPDAEKRRKQAEKALEDVVGRQRQLEAALFAARQREAAEAATRARQAVVDTWAEAQTKADRCTSLALDLEALAAEFAEKERALLAETEALYHSIPAKPSDSFLLLGGAIEKAVRLQLLRCGMQWAIPDPRTVADIPSVTHSVTEACAVAMRLRPTTH